MATQVILLTATAKNGVPYSGQIGVNVNDITCPITGAGGGGVRAGYSYVTVRKEMNNRVLGDNVNVDVWTVSESLTQIAAMSFDLEKITVTKPKPFGTATVGTVPYVAPTPFDAVFFLPDIIEPVEDDIAGCHFYYIEEGDPNPVKYHTTLTTAQLVGGMLPTGGVQSVNGDHGPAVTLTVSDTGPGGNFGWVGTQLQVPLGATDAFEPITYAALLALTVAGTVVPGTTYLITDRGDEGIVALGTTATTLSIDAVGLFLNADYGTAGDYSGVPGFVAQLGIWNAGLTPAINDVVIWNNNHYVNLTGAVGTAPDGDAVNWLVLARTRTTGFIPVSDRIIYDFLNDYIVTEWDIKGNKVSDETTSGRARFPFGNPTVYYNDVVLGNIQDNIWNQRGNIASSVIMTSLDASPELVFTDFMGTLQGVEFTSDSFTTRLDLTNCQGTILDSKFNSGCQLIAALNAGVSLNFVNISLPVGITFNPAVTLSNKTISVEVNNMPANVDITGLTTMDITPEAFAGQVTVSSSNATETVDTITGLTQDSFPMRFYPAAGLTVTFTNLAANFKLSGNIVAVLNGTNGDWIEFSYINGAIYQTSGETY